MANRLPQRVKAGVLTFEGGAGTVGLEAQAARPCLLRQREQIVRAQTVLLCRADLQGAVGARGAELVAGPSVGGVQVGAGIDDERLPADGELERELVVVSVGPDPPQADVPAAHDAP